MKYFKPEESYEAPFEPVNPCRQFETRACVDLSVDDERRYRSELCEIGNCTRFPERDKKEVLVKGEGPTLKERIDP